jgi:hypothetical protein
MCPEVWAYAREMLILEGTYQVQPNKRVMICVGGLCTGQLHIETVLDGNSLNV